MTIFTWLKNRYRIFAFRHQINRYDFWVTDESVDWDVAGDHNNTSGPKKGSSLARTEAGTPRESSNWSHAEVLLLITCYESHMLHCHARTKKRKYIWTKISTEMRDHDNLRTASDCEKKFKGLKRTYDKHRLRKRKSGRDRKEWPFSKEIDNFLSSSAEYQAPTASSMPMEPSTSALSDVQLSGQTRETHEWQADERQRYKQQLKMQRLKLKMLKRIAESASQHSN
ncbi:zinc finger and SCAN domain-containing protein 29-like [Rhipicephalus sanguineus]|uniref:zinc finger and SCAN domain-containing protein 29-like n=1 Tax=Rhipicephalus sanguineus TaxID=34632 RepID=UPI0020C44205|nr:zinc finger and SCAN domain-containing protein 29-like [Rhipicephalus sanguineus]